MDLTLGIYLIDVIQDLGNISGLIAFTSGLTVGICCIVAVCATVDNESEMVSDALSVASTFLKVFLPALFFTVLLPSEKTMYLMAASELAQYGLAEFTPELEALREVVQDKLQELQGPDTE